MKAAALAVAAAILIPAPALAARPSLRSVVRYAVRQGKRPPLAGPGQRYPGTGYVCQGCGRYWIRSRTDEQWCPWCRRAGRDVGRAAAVLAGIAAAAAVAAGWFGGLGGGVAL